MKERTAQELLEHLKEQLGTALAAEIERSFFDYELVEDEPENAGDSSLDPFLDPDSESVEHTIPVVQLDIEDVKEVTLGVFSHDGCANITKQLNEMILEDYADWIADRYGQEADEEG